MLGATVSEHGEILGWGPSDPWLTSDPVADATPRAELSVKNITKKECFSCFTCYIIEALPKSGF